MIIYKILNKITGKCYVGQTVRKLDTRIYWHLHSAKTGPTSLLHRAISKYGIQSFEYSVIDVADTKEALNEKEVFWIEQLKTRVPDGYNMTNGGTGGANNHGKPHLKETIQKMSAAHSGKRNPFYGRKHSEETREKMSRSQKGNQHLLGHKHSAEARKKMSETHKKRIRDKDPEIPEKENKPCQKMN